MPLYAYFFGGLLEKPYNKTNSAKQIAAWRIGEVGIKTNLEFGTEGGDEMKSKMEIFFLVLFLLSGPVVPAGHTCTAFVLKHGDRILFGENFDWSVSDGLIMVNKRNVRKTAFSTGAGNQQLVSWKSKYGSLTFNHVGREFFHGGINSKGLFVTGLMLRDSEYSPIDSRPIISPTQWKQYILDNCATVEQAIAIQSQIRIFYKSGRFPTHFFLADKSGRCAVIEFVEGKMICSSGSAMPVNILTNSTYANSIEYLKEHEGFGGKRLVSNSSSSLDRFVRTTNMVKSYNPKSSGSMVDYGFKVLDNVAQGEYTAWRIIYDVNEMRIYFITLFNPKIQYIDLKSFDLSCDAPPEIFDLNNKVTGDVTKYFKYYTTQANRDLITRVNSFYHFSLNILDALTQYSEDLLCVEE